MSHVEASTGVSGDGPDQTSDGAEVISLRVRALGVAALVVAASTSVFLVSVVAAHRETASAHGYMRPAIQVRDSLPIPTSIAVPPLSPQPPVVALKDMTPEQALDTNRAVPFSVLPNPPARPFRTEEIADEDRARAETCLTQAIYYEAGFESLAGEQAVAQVVLNRVRHPIFPKTVCGVVFQGAELKTGCQFTFTCDGAMDRPPEAKAWARAQAVAAAALDGSVMKSVGEATHYHTQWVVPYWSPSLVKLTQIGAHIFYRWTGTSGQPPAFAGRYVGGEPGAEAPQVVQLAPPQTVVAAIAAPMTSAAPNATPSTAAAEPALVLTRNDPPPLVLAAPSIGPITPPARTYFGPPRSHSANGAG